MTTVSPLLSPMANGGVSSTRQRPALSRVLAATATCRSSVTRNIQPAVAGAVATPRALGSGFVQRSEIGLITAFVPHGPAAFLCRACGSRSVRRAPPVVCTRRPNLAVNRTRRFMLSLSVTIGAAGRLPLSLGVKTSAATHRYVPRHWWICKASGAFDSSL